MTLGLHPSVVIINECVIGDNVTSGAVLDDDSIPAIIYKRVYRYGIHRGGTIYDHTRFHIGKRVILDHVERAIEELDSDSSSLECIVGKGIMAARINYAIHAANEGVS